MTRRSTAGGVASLMVLLVLHACTFMRPSTADPFGRSYDQLSELIDDVAEAQAAGLQPEVWLAKRDLPMLTDRASWDAILGELYARRASSLVRRAPVVSVTETWVGMLSSDYRRRSDASPVGFAIGCILVVPPALLLDVLVVPVTFSFSFVQDLRVDEADRVRAQEDLSRAIHLGVDGVDLWMW